MDHYNIMHQCLEYARRGAILGEVPVGAAVVSPNGQIVALAHNEVMTTKDPTAHAEIVVLRRASQTLGIHRLDDCTLYVTLEPCAMCAKAISLARIQTLVYGAPDTKGGAVDQPPFMFTLPTCHHRPQVIHGIQADISSQLLKSFFKSRRA